MKLNDTSVRALRLAPGETDKTWFDDNLGGYGVRARKSGAKSYVVQYDFGGKTEKITIGSIELWKEVKARKAAKEVLAAVRLGRNPAAEKRRARAETAETFGALLPRYLAHKRAQLKPRSFEEVERHVLTHCRPLHSRPIGDIDQRAAAILLANIAERSGPRACNAVRASGSGFFTWAMRDGIADVNPFANTNKAAVADPRERTPLRQGAAGNLARLSRQRLWRAC